MSAINFIILLKTTACKSTQDIKSFKLAGNDVKTANFAKINKL